MFGFFSKTGSARKQATGAARRTPSLNVEALEDRLALSTYTVSDGKLWIGGTDSGETIKVYQVNYGYGERYAVYENGWAVANFSASQLYNRDVIVFGRGGNDDIRNFTGLNLWAYGGDGYDTLVGGWGNDHLFGEGQTDYLYGGDGSDWLCGGWADRSWCDQTADYLHGGAGVDYFREPYWWDASDTWADFYNDYNVIWYN